MAVSAGEPSGAGNATALQPQQSSQMQLRRRAIAKGRRRRGENLLPRLGLTLLMGAGLIMFASDSAPGAKSVGHREPTGSWDGLQASEDATGYGFGDLSGRHLAATLYPPTAPAPAPCPVEVGVGNSTYPSLGLEGASATVVQFVVLCFMFLGLAIVCDSFFEAALSRICEAMNLKDDVAGATWMAAGGSAPELATSVMGLFVSQSDIGFGTIVGSAVFNVLFVIACCAFVAPNLKLTWWPLARDCAYNCFSMSILVFVISDLKVEFYEAIILLMLYGVYVVIMYFNERLEAWVLTRVKASELATNALMKGLRDLFDNGIFAGVLYSIIFANSIVIILELINDGDRAAELPCACGDRVGENLLPYSSWWWANFGFNIFFIIEMLSKWYAYGFFGYWKRPLNCFDGALVFLILVEFILTAVAGADGIGIGAFRSLRVLRFIRAARMLRLIRITSFFVKNKENKVTPGMDGYQDRPKENGKEAEAPKEEEEEEDDDDDEPFNPFEIPESMVGKVFWLLGFPLSLGMWLTIPDCRREMFKKWWLATFFMCIVWIGALAFIMVWMITEFGIQYEVRDTIMGITLLAAGTSIPDALSSVAVARRGHGDMAVSSSIGSNIFDILIGLPLPWFIYGAIMRPAIGPDLGAPYVVIKSESLAVMILSLFVMVALVVTTIHISGWILSVKLGIMMMVLYGIFLMLCLLLELDILFGPCDYTTV